MMVMDAAAGRMEFEDALPQCHPLNPSNEQVMPVMAASYFRKTTNINKHFFLSFSWLVMKKKVIIYHIYSHLAESSPIWEASKSLLG